MNQSATQGEFLFHTTRQFTGPPFPKRFDLPVYRRYQIVIALQFYPEQSGEKGQIFRYGQIGIKRKTSRHIPYPFPNGPIIGHDIGPIDRSPPAVGNRCCGKEQDSAIPGQC